MANSAAKNILYFSCMLLSLEYTPRCGIGELSGIGMFNLGNKCLKIIAYHGTYGSISSPTLDTVSVINFGQEDCSFMTFAHLSICCITTYL